MATSRIIEEESGIYRGRRIHRHNGYYAGDFSAQPPTSFGLTRPAASRFRSTRPPTPGAAHPTTAYPTTWTTYGSAAPRR